MKRSTFITWDQLKVGLLIVLAIVVLAVAAVRLGQAANLFTERYELIALLPNAGGLRENLLVVERWLDDQRVAGLEDGVGNGARSDVQRLVAKEPHGAHLHPGIGADLLPDALVNLHRDLQSL